MTLKLLNEHHMEFQSLKNGCTGPSESTHVKMPHCWKSHVMAQIIRQDRLEEETLAVNTRGRKLLDRI